MPTFIGRKTRSECKINNFPEIRSGSSVLARHRWRNCAPLMPPAFALAEKHPVAGNGPKDSNRSGSASIIASIFDENPVDGLRRVDQHLGSPEPTPDENVALVSGVGPDQKSVGSRRAQKLAQTRVHRGDAERGGV